jgi:hypothetical protein
MLSWERDFFLAYPPPAIIEEFRDNEHHPAFNSYLNARLFFTASKPRQREILAGHGFPIPFTIRGMGELLGAPNGSHTFIARPLRHSQGAGFRVLTHEQAHTTGQWDPTREYLQTLFDKTNEYRIVIVRGEPLITLLKKIPEDTPVDAPWNHAHGASFVTVHNWDNNRLRHTDVYDRIRAARPFFESIDIGGLDVLFNKHDHSYVVCELNLCPSLSIQNNLERVASHVLSSPRQPQFNRTQNL